MLDQTDQNLVIYLARCTLERVPGDQNWLEEKAVGGLPTYICEIARAIHRSGSHSISSSIAIAVSRAKAWAAGRGGVSAKTRVKAAKAVAEWESKKKAAKLDNKTKLSAGVLFSDIDLEFSMSDADLEKAARIPCTEKANRSLLETVRLSHKLKLEEAELLKLSKTVRDLL